MVDKPLPLNPRAEGMALRRVLDSKPVCRVCGRHLRCYVSTTGNDAAQGKVRIRGTCLSNNHPPDEFVVDLRDLSEEA